MISIINRRVKALRTEYELTQEELASKLGLKKSAVSGWETGTRTPEVDTLLKMCELFNVRIQYFFEEDYEKLNPYAVVIAEAKSNKISAEQLMALVKVLSKR